MKIESFPNFSSESVRTRKMLRRRLRLSYSEDDDDDDEEIQQPPQHYEFEDELQPQQPTVTHQPQTVNSKNPNPIPSETLEISDDELYIDVSDNLSPPSPEPEQNSTATTQPLPPVFPPTSGCPINDFLRRLGLNLKREWLDDCARGLETSVPGFAGIDVATKAKLCFEKFLLADMNYCGGGVLPENVDSMHLVDLHGPYVLQVDEIVNISCPLRGRYQKAPSGIKRCLKLSMTDGTQRVFGMEYRSIDALDVMAPAGLKVAICNVHVRHGLLMLVPEAFEVLGGLVEELDVARQRLVDEVNKPPRGKRTRSGVLLPLATRATLAAWQSNSVDVHVCNSSITQNTSSSVENDQGATLNTSGTNNGSVTEDRIPNTVVNAASNSISNIVSDVEAMHMGTHRATVPANSAKNSFPTVSNVEEAHMAAGPATRANAVANQSSSTFSNVEEIPMEAINETMENAQANKSSPPVSDVEDIHMVDASNHPLILSADREIPFTYLASLSAKWAAMKDNASSCQGRIKCFLTGVKGFQYKQRMTYELRVYVDDGSLISEIFIDHNVVRRGIGYSPEEVTSALCSSVMKKVYAMKETLRQFQVFLANFEGTMLLEINGRSPLPVALEMNEGCPQSDAWLLLRRLKSFSPAQTERRHFQTDTIVLSP